MTTLQEQLAATRAELEAKREALGLQQPTPQPVLPPPTGKPWQITREDAQDHAKYRAAREAAEKEGRSIEIIEATTDDEVSNHLRQIKLDDNEIPISQADAANESELQHLRMLAGQNGKRIRILPAHLLADDYVKPSFDESPDASDSEAD